MSGLGHFAAGFAARPLAPKVPLAALLAGGVAACLRARKHAPTLAPA